jgi:hypothetical protein
MILPGGQNRRVGGIAHSKEQAMSETLVTQIIREARNLIANPDSWIEGELARTAAGESCDPWDAEATRFCAYGALVRAAYGISNDSNTAMHFAQSATAVMFGPGGSDPGQLYEINDGEEGREAVLKLFDETLGAVKDGRASHYLKRAPKRVLRSFLDN